MGLDQQQEVVRCVRCGLTTTDPDKWDPEAELEDWEPPEDDG